MNSILLTIFNKENIIHDVLDGIFKNAIEKFEIIICLDACVDNTEKIVLDYLYNAKCKNLAHFNVLKANNLFETRCNNMCARASQGEYVIIVQDDCIIKEYGFDERILRPMRTFNDIFAVTGNCAHNWYFNENSKDIHIEPHGRDWADILLHKDHANRTTIKRDIFAIRDSANRGPLAINRKDLETLGYFSEEIFKQEFDDHILMYDAWVQLKKKVGFYMIDFESKPEWGGSREGTQTKPWALEANNINSRLLLSKHKGTMNKQSIENRELK